MRTTQTLLVKLFVFIFVITWLHPPVLSQNPDSLWKVSVQKFDLGDFHGVISDMNQLIDQIPDLPEAYYNRGVARLNLGDQEDACKDMEYAKTLGLDNNLNAVNTLCNVNRIRDLMIKEFYGNVKVYPETGFRPLYTRADTLRGALRRERTCFDVYFYDLGVKINPKRKSIEGKNSVLFHVMYPTRKIQIDLFDNMKILSITWNGNKLKFEREYNAVFVEFPEELKTGEDQKITIDYKGKPVIAPNPPWEGGFVWDNDENGDYWDGVACEQLGASSWWPVKDHLSDKPDSMRITLDVPQGYQAVSNGNPIRVSDAPGRYNRFTWFVSYPISNYNATFYIGKYFSFNDTLIMNTDTLMLNYNVLRWNLEKAKEHFQQVKEVLSFYSGAFGEYPFKKDGFGLVESPYEGMEHQTAIAYGNGYTNQENYRNNQYDYIIVHESAHEWWGNSVTAFDMADIWIHEGFATYAELMFLENALGRDDYLFELNRYAQYILNIWPMVQHRDVNENSFAGNDVYFKGAMMLHCLRCDLNNDSLFFKMIHDFAVQNRYRVVTSNDFVSFVNYYTGKNYKPFFDKFLYDTGHPVLDYTFYSENGDLTVRYKWIHVEQGFSMPFAIENDQGETFRLEASTEWRETKLSRSDWFNFFNSWKGYESCPWNSFTWYATHWENTEW